MNRMSSGEVAPKRWLWADKSLQAGDLELILVPAIGGRMMDVKFRGVSLLFQNPDLLSYLPNLEKLQELPTLAKHFPFPLWGGEKTWIAPDSNWPDGAPHAVLDSGEYSYRRHNSLSATMTSPVCPDSGLQVNRQIMLVDSSRWSIRHQIINRGTTSRTAGIWSVLMTNSPVTYYCRTVAGETPVTVFGDAGNAFSRVGYILRINCTNRQEFKLGMHPTGSTTAAKVSTPIGDVWIINRAKELKDSTAYAHGQALEFFNSGHYDYGELEWHSPVTLMQPTESLVFELDYQVELGIDGLSDAEMFQRLEAKSGDKA